MTVIDASKLAESEVSTLSRNAGEELVVCDKQMIETKFSWIFFNQSKKFIETDETKYRLAGNGPIVVIKLDGRVIHHGSAESIESIIEKYS